MPICLALKAMRYTEQPGLREMSANDLQTHGQAIGETTGSYY